jgi:voltage-gated potassium channel Kch
MRPVIEFFSTLVRLLRAIVGAWQRDPQFRTLVGLVFFTLLSGTIFYTLEEGWSIVDAFYFSVTTLTTVGLGDLSPTTTFSKLFTVVYIFAGLSLVLGFIDTVAKETFRGRMRGQGSGEDREDASAG